MITDKSTKSIGFLISAKLNEEIDKYCLETGMRKGKLAEIAISQYLDRETKKLAKK